MQEQADVMTPPAHTRIECVEEYNGIRYRTLLEPRSRHPDKPLMRSRMPCEPADPDAILARLDHEKATMARRVLREGARGWRLWSTVRRRAGPNFSPFLVESELLDALVRECGLLVEDRYRRHWVAHRFSVDDTVRTWLGILSPGEFRAELEPILTQPHLLEALTKGPPRGMDWASFAFVLRAAEDLTDLSAHGVRPGARELAGRIDHTKAWTERRRALMENLLQRPFDELVAHFDRLVEVKGPLAHRRGDLWASEIDAVELRIEGDLTGVILVENRETFRSLLALSDLGYIVLWVPGGPPPAEISLIRRLSQLQPGLRFHACFDLDPAGVRIASLVAERAEIELSPAGMTPALFDSARRRLPLNAWDERELERLHGRSGSLEPIRAAIASAGSKVEQEIVQQQLYALFAAGTGD